MEKKQVKITRNKFIKFLIDYDFTTEISAGGDEGSLSCYFNKDIPTTHELYPFSKDIVSNIQEVLSDTVFEDMHVNVNGNSSSSGNVDINSDGEFVIFISTSDDDDCDTLGILDLLDFIKEHKIDDISLSCYCNEINESSISLSVSVNTSIFEKDEEFLKEMNQIIEDNEYDLERLLIKKIDNFIEEEISPKHNYEDLKYFMYESDIFTNNSNLLNENYKLYFDIPGQFDESQTMTLEQIILSSGINHIMKKDRITHLIFE